MQWHVMNCWQCRVCMQTQHTLVHHALQLRPVNGLHQQMLTPYAQASAPAAHARELLLLAVLLGYCWPSGAACTSHHCMHLLGTHKVGDIKHTAALVQLSRQTS